MSAHRATASTRSTRSVRRAGFSAKKIGLTVALVGTAAGVAGLGTFGDFSSTTSVLRTDASGTVVVALGATGAANRLTVGSSGLVPGDTVQRAFDLNNTGTESFASVALTTSASPSSLLDSDATNGLQMVINSCSVAWTEAGTAPAYTYTCGGTTSTVLASRAVIGSALALSNLTLTSGASNHLKVTLTLPSTAGNTFQGLTSTTDYVFLATQRTATNK